MLKGWIAFSITALLALSAHGQAIEFGGPDNSTLPGQPLRPLPADCTIAVGSDRVVAAVNEKIQIRNKTTGALLNACTGDPCPEDLRYLFVTGSNPLNVSTGQTVSLNARSATNTVIDPKVIYDPVKNAFVVIVIAKENGSTNVYLVRSLERCES